MIDMKKLMEFSDMVLSRAMTDLLVDGCVGPVLVVLKDGGADVDTVEVPMANDEEMAAVGDLLKEKTDGADALVFFMDARIKDLEKDEPTPETLEGNPEATDALYLAIYRPEGTTLKQVIYSKDSKGVPAFLDLGWEDNVTGETGPMTNPWLTKK